MQSVHLYVADVLRAHKVLNNNKELMGETYRPKAITRTQSNNIMATWRAAGHSDVTVSMTQRTEKKEAKNQRH